MMHWEPTSRVRRTQSRPIPRRRASALLLVVTVLGILFVTGVAFLTTINFESQMLNVEQRSKTDEIGVENVADVVNEALRNTWVAKPGVPGGAAPLGEPVQITPIQNQTIPGGGGGVWHAFRPDALTYVEVPGVHGLFSQIEPTPTVNAAGEPVMTYDWFTDLKALRSDPTAGMIYGNKRRIDTSVGNLSVLDTYRLPDGSTDPDAPLVIDADGDGLVDSILVDVMEIGVSPRDAQVLARVVNPPTSPGNRALVGLRIVPHGGMVNLAEGHPNLISAIFPGYPSPWFAKFWSERSGAYNPMIEERALRNRGGVLPARLMIATALQGNPYDTTDQDLPGGGDFAAWLFPQDESVMAGRHRFMPYATPAINSSDYLEWFDRMDPESGANGRRHLVTTISHDNLLARPSGVLLPNPSGGFSHADAFERMKEVNRIVVAANYANGNACGVPDDGLPFEYPNYPHDMLNGAGSGDWCDCVGTALSGGTCSIDPRKGRLRLSLEWLDAAYVPGTGATDNDPATIGELQRIRLIQDAFTMMLLNAREPNWGTWDGNANAWVHTTDGLKEVSRIAASLTANMLDFADEDGIPTPVQLRSADYTNAGAFGVPVPDEYVFGVEHLQPYITEIAAHTPDTVPDGDPRGDGIADRPGSSWAIEIFNPTNVRLPSAQQRAAGSRFFIQVGALGTPIPLNDVRGSDYLVLYNDPNSNFTIDNRNNHQASPELEFQNGDVIYLLQLVKGNLTGLPDRYVVVDQFQTKGGLIGKVVRGTDPRPIYRYRDNNDHVSMSLATTKGWFSPIPADEVDRAMGDSLGVRNTKSDESLRPVQVLMANNCPGDINRTKLADAFPTTGAMHLLLRDANRSIDQAKSRTGGTVDDDKLAFTAYLYDGRTEVDNGRMPIFDTANKHRVDPAKNPAAWDSYTNQYLDLPPNAAGDIDHLPWGQLLSDYFTALPLGSEEGLWDNPAGASDAAFWVAQQSMGPRVDRNGLRVHGRIDLNAAPWTVLAGLPLMPMSEFEKGKKESLVGPPHIQRAIRKALGLVRPNVPNQMEPTRRMPSPATPENLLNPPNPVASDVLVWDSTAASLGEQRAKAIVAYRELREFRNGPNTLTGNYEYAPLSSGYYARGWNVEDPPGAPGYPGVRKLPTVRAGTGFLTVGELANVRHPSAALAGGNPPPAQFAGFSYYRLDGGVVGNSTMQEDYLSAVALLVALGDWATVRSDVYTVYGTIWGQPYDDGNPNTNDDAALMERALRFQQTTDRNPAFLGQSPAQLGERMMTKYTNVNTD